ncbi:MAG: hypothetical protein V4568_14170 [Pseudomonadota bacterium]
MNRIIIRLPLLVTCVTALLLLIHGPIAQLPHYHAFADQRALFGIPHAADFLSNVGFAVVGIWGLISLWSFRKHPVLARGWSGYCLFMLSLVLTAAGSSFYHLAPDNARLVWDRLPIALACAGLIAATHTELRIDGNGRYNTILLALFAVISVTWWYVTDLLGHGDLRIYLFLQGMPLLLIPLWQAIFQAPRQERLAFGLAIFFYVMAKVAEQYDHELFTMLGWISGHTVKHLLATAGAAILVNSLIKRVSNVSSVGSEARKSFDNNMRKLPC